MDNVTHSLIGVTLAQTVVRPTTSPARRKAIFWTAVLGSNLADFDSIGVKLMGGSKLDYLLYHRGITHTFLFLPVIALVSAGVGWLVSRERVRALAPLFALGLVAALLHLGADAMNDYGVRPYLPFNSRRYYGDFVFILEPMLWFLMIPLAFRASLSRWARWFWGACGAGLLLALWLGPFAAWWWAGALTVFAGLGLLFQWKKPRVWPVYAGIALVLGSFFVASRIVRQAIAGYIGAATKGEAGIQLVTTPAPGDPLCWRTIVSTQTRGGTYIARLGVVSFAPGLLDPHRCFFRLDAKRLAPMIESSVPDTEALHWAGEFHGTDQELRQLSREPLFAKFLLFARVPFWLRKNDHWIVGDLRYDNEPTLGFAKIDLENP